MEMNKTCSSVDKQRSFGTQFGLSRLGGPVAGWDCCVCVCLHPNGRVTQIVHEFPSAVRLARAHITVHPAPLHSMINDDDITVKFSPHSIHTQYRKK